LITIHQNSRFWAKKIQKQLGAVFGFYKESHGQEITELK
jgi:hypothetical protein